jgi:hypothetical protein
VVFVEGNRCDGEYGKWMLVQLEWQRPVKDGEYDEKLVEPLVLHEEDLSPEGVVDALERRICSPGLVSSWSLEGEGQYTAREIHSYDR